MELVNEEFINPNGADITEHAPGSLISFGDMVISLWTMPKRWLLSCSTTESKPTVASRRSGDAVSRLLGKFVRRKGSPEKINSVIEGRFFVDGRSQTLGEFWK